MSRLMASPRINGDTYEEGETDQKDQAPPDPTRIEYDFVEHPSQDFFCPVTFELLTEPHQTTCCGNHLSQEAASRLQRDGKPCPMCKVPQLSTMPDKFYKRKVNELEVRCPQKKSGCKWVGQVNEVKHHSQSCPKRPWKCQYCPFASTYDTGVSEHVPVCKQHPVVCPNNCEVGTVPRCEVEVHLMVCPLEPVACEYAEVGCDVKVPRRDLARHMEEGQQQHLLSTTLLNLRLTRENNEEKNKLLKVIQQKDKESKHLKVRLEAEGIHIQKQIERKDEEISKKDRTIAENSRQFQQKEEDYKHKISAKDHHIKERDAKIKEKDEAIADLQKQLKQMQDGLEAKVTHLQQQVVKYGGDTQQHLTDQKKQVESMFVRSGLIPYELKVQGFTLHAFTLTGFSKYQAQGGYGHWWSDPFYSHPGGYKFQLNVRTNGSPQVRGECMTVCFRPSQGKNEEEEKLVWPVTTESHVHLWNQLGDHSHHKMVCSKHTWTKEYKGHGGGLGRFIKLTELGRNVEKNTQYLKNDCLHFQVFFKAYL